MTYLIYCFTRVPPLHWADLPTGVNNQPVELIPAGAVGAVCSPSFHEQDLRDFAPILQHTKIVDAVFSSNPVIPVRFGSHLEARENIVSHLTTFGQHYEKQLCEIQGSVEMGIRVLLQAIDEDLAQSDQTNLLQKHQSDPLQRPGIAYLKSRRHVYTGETQRDTTIKNLLSDFKTSFKGSFQKVKLEKSFRQVSLNYGREADRPAHGERHNSLVSFYFLVPENQLNCFTTLFRELSEKSSHKLMLTGPWPPYNFVAAPASNSMASLLNVHLPSDQ